MDWHNTRLVPFIPEHFSRIKLQEGKTVDEILPWITEHCSGRYGFANDFIYDSFMTTEIFYVGFEKPEDATMFSLFAR